MSSAPLVIVATAGAVVVWLVRGRPRIASTAGIVGLVVALGAIGLQHPGESFSVAGLGLVVTEYSRMALAIAGVSFLVLALLEVAAGGQGREKTARAEDVAPATQLDLGMVGEARAAHVSDAGDDGSATGDGGGRRRPARRSRRSAPGGDPTGRPGTPAGDAESPVAGAGGEPEMRPRRRRTHAALPARAEDSVSATLSLPAPVAASRATAGAVASMPVPLGVALLTVLAFLGVGLPTADPAAYRYLPNAAGPEVSLVLLTAAGILALPASLHAAEDLAALRTAMRELRLIGAAGGLAIVGAAWLALLSAHALPDPQASTAGLAFIGTAMVLRMGAMPLHAVRARMGSLLPGPHVALVGVWLPTTFVLAGLAWSRAALTPLGLAAPAEASAVLVLIAFVTLIAGSLAATLQEDLRRLVIYSVIGDGGFALLALVAGTTASAPAGRAWLLVYALSKTALIAWAIAARRVFGTDLLEDLRGWARYAPLLGLALLAVAIGSFGLPGWSTFEARQRLIQHALDGAWPWTPLLAGAAWLAVLPYVRLALVGLRTPEVTVRRADGEWPALRHGRAPAPAWAAQRRLPPRLAVAIGVAAQHAPTFAASLALALALALLALGAGQTLLMVAAGTG